MNTEERSARFEAAARALPLVGILRGIKPEEAGSVGEELHRRGFRLIEVPLNSPRPFESIMLLRDRLPADCIVGAGTVLREDDVDTLAALGADLVVMPHANVSMIARSRQRGLLCMPAAATPTEAFAAAGAGADALKLFPAEMITPAVLKSMRAVLPPSLGLFPVGGITPEGMAPYLAAGALGFGLGSALYKPGQSAQAVGQAAARFVEAWKRLHP